MTTELLVAPSRANGHLVDEHGHGRRTRADDGLSVLVVDDDVDTAQSFAELLALSGHAARTAGCGRDALRLAADEVPDVVLLDIGLPDMSGWEVAHRLRIQASGKQSLLVAVTGFGTTRDQLRSADAGIDLHLTKPTDPVVILALLRWVREVLLVR